LIINHDAKLKLYAFFKQACIWVSFNLKFDWNLIRDLFNLKLKTFKVSVGICNTAKTGMMDIIGKAKWHSWKLVQFLKIIIVIIIFCLRKQPKQLNCKSKFFIFLLYFYSN
jgi:acyl-CoA-binding protein